MHFQSTEKLLEQMMVDKQKKHLPNKKYFFQILKDKQNLNDLLQKKISDIDNWNTKYTKLEITIENINQLNHEIIWLDSTITAL